MCRENKYAYTLQGWIKAVNSNSLKSTTDMGHDGLAGNVNEGFAKDAFGYSLNYFDKDYKPIGTLADLDSALATLAHSDVLKARHELFNGNISSMVTTISKPTAYTATTGTATALPQATAYKYDQLNRIVEMQAYKNLNLSTNAWGFAGVYDGSYHNKFTYDGNGNILTQERKDSAGHNMEYLTYHYAKQNGRTIQNRLYHVNDTVHSSYSSTDIDDQGSYDSLLTRINAHNNYGYDEIGNLNRDSTEQIDTIKWSVYGKIKEVIRTSGSSKKNLKFDYDASGNRIAKHVYSGAGAWEFSEFYTRDAQGKVLSIYKKTNADFAQTERNIYGSSRIGIDKTTTSMVGATAGADTAVRYLGNKHFNLQNHLGNILVTVSDKKIPRNITGNSISHYEPQVLSATDYYPFGSIMPGRNFNSNSYRFGLNGKEKDDEVKGTGNWYDYGLRPYDPRIGRPPCIDPLAKQFPELSPYQFYHNNPIRNIDLDGAEGLPNEIYNAAARAGKAVIQKATAYVVGKVVEMTVDYAAEKTAEKIKEKTTPAQQQAIGLTGEFFFGVGPEERHFGPNDPITKDLMKSNYTDKTRSDFYEVNKKALESGDFSKVQTVERTYKFTGVLTEGGNAQQFVGSARITISLAEDKKTLNYSIYNETSKNSLLYNGYIPFVDVTSHSRDENPVMGTTSQTYTSSEPLVTPKK